MTCAGELPMATPARASGFDGDLVPPLGCEHGRACRPSLDATQTAEGGRMRVLLAMICRRRFAVDVVHDRWPMAPRAIGIGAGHLDGAIVPFTHAAATGDDVYARRTVDGRRRRQLDRALTGFHRAPTRLCKMRARQPSKTATPIASRPATTSHGASVPAMPPAARSPRGGTSSIRSSAWA